jgi:hypothetical protein
MIRKAFISFSVLLLVYMLWPGPGKISDFKPLPDSSKSTLPGDTYQIPNVAAYYSDNFRVFVTSFYKSNYWRMTLLPFPPIVLIHPPEYSWLTIKKHTDSTYLEEFVYPLRDSIYVNGFEPFYPDGSPKFWGSAKFDADGQSFFTKTTLRYYPSSVLSKILVWMGITLSIYWLFKIGKKILT